MRVFQHIDELHPYDGMGNDCRGFAGIFTRLGIENYIVTRDNKSFSTDHILSLGDSILEKSSDIHIMHYGGSGYPLDNFTRRRGRKILRFHNVTPHEFYGAVNQDVYLSMEKFFHKSVFELKSLENRIDYCISDSDYNSETLASYANIPSTTIPILRDYSLPTHLTQTKSNHIQLVFLSRIVPNKKIEDCILTLYYLKKIFNNSTLEIIGGVVPGIHDYYDNLVHFAQELGLTDSIKFHTRLTEDSKKEIFSRSDYFLSMSEHEGFGIPLVEAMENSLPILAYNSSAIQETLKGGGVLFTEKNFPGIAELILEIQNNSYLLSSILERQKQAMEYYINFPFEERIQKYVFNNQLAGSISR